MCRQDPYILRNHLGGIDCRLCLTQHPNENSYLAHTQGKKHQTNLAMRAAKDQKEQSRYNPQMLLMDRDRRHEKPKKQFVKIGKPGFSITKVHEPVPAPPVGVSESEGERRVREKQGGRIGLLFKMPLPQIKDGVRPLYRIMSSFEQHVEPQDRAWQYLVVAAEPYESIAFKLEAREADRTPQVLTSALPAARPKNEPGTWSHWDPDTKTYSALRPREGPACDAGARARAAHD